MSILNEENTFAMNHIAKNVFVVKGLDINDVAKELQADIICHGCNCFHTMGAGVAARLASLYPRIVDADKQTPYGDINKLGTFSKVDFPNGSSIYNLYTQHIFGMRGVVMTQWYSVTEALLRAVGDYAYRQAMLGCDRDIVVVIPAIGTGLGGGSMIDFEMAVREFMDISSSNVTLYITIK